MRPSFRLSLLLLSLILSEQARGIRLEKGSQIGGVEAQQYKPIQVKEIGGKANNGDQKEEAIQCKDGQCSGNNKKLTTSVTPSTTTTTTIAKNEKIGRRTSTNNTPQNIARRDDEHDDKTNIHLNFSLASSEKNGFEHYPEEIDLAEMDYSPARRKAPIHN